MHHPRSLQTCHEAGVLAVISEAKSEHYVGDIETWYDTEHGPARLKLGEQYFLNGYRYKSCGPCPRYLAIYDMPNLSMGGDEVYTDLRRYRSKREQNIFAFKLDVLSRRFLRVVFSSNALRPAARSISVQCFDIEYENITEITYECCNVLASITKSNSAVQRSRLLQIVPETEEDPNSKTTQGFVVVFDLHNEEISINSKRNPFVDLQEILRRDSRVLTSTDPELFRLEREFHAKDYQAPP